MLQRAKDLRDSAHGLLSTITTTSGTTMTGAGQAASGGVWREQAQLASAVEALVNEAADLVDVMSSGQEPSLSASASFIVCAMDAVLLLAQRVDKLEHKLEEEARRIQDQIKQLQDQFNPLQESSREDSDDLLFCELASQLVSKMVRKAMPGYSAWQARGAPLCLIRGSAVYHDIISRYPMLEIGMEAADEPGGTVARSVPEPPVTEASLRKVIECVGDAVLPAAEQLLRCLVELADDLQEPLFVPAVPPT